MGRAPLPGRGFFMAAECFASGADFLYGLTICDVRPGPGLVQRIGAAAMGPP